MTLLATILLLAATPTATDAASQEGTQTTPQAQPAKEKKICKREELAMGSRMAGKVCKTAAEWKAQADAERDGFLNRDKD